MSLLDTLTPATPPAPKNARTVRPLDHTDDERDETLPVVALEPAKFTPTKASQMNNKAASVRALLNDHPEGLGYDAIAKGTGIARDSIGKHIANLLIAGDVKGYEFNDGRGRVFKITETGAQKVGDRKPDQTPSTAAARSEGAQGTGLPEAGRNGRADAAESPGRPAADAATKTATPREVSAPTRTAGADPMSAAPPAAAAAINLAPFTEKGPTLDFYHRRSQNESALAIATDLVIVAAANLAAAVRDCVEFSDDDAVGIALRNFERADRLYVTTKAERT